MYSTASGWALVKLVSGFDCLCGGCLFRFLWPHFSFSWWCWTWSSFEVLEWVHWMGPCLYYPIGYAHGAVCPNTVVVDDEIIVVIIAGWEFETACTKVHCGYTSYREKCYLQLFRETMHWKSSMPSGVSVELRIFHNNIQWTQLTEYSVQKSCSGIVRLESPHHLRVHQSTFRKRADLRRLKARWTCTRTEIKRGWCQGHYGQDQSSRKTFFTWFVSCCTDSPCMDSWCKYVLCQHGTFMIAERRLGGIPRDGKKGTCPLLRD